MKTGSIVLLEDETLRDGLQVEKKIFSLEEKLRIYMSLEEAGVKRVQVGSFVHPKLVPQMADTAELIQAIRQESNGNTLLTALILNGKGLERALACRLDHLSMSVSVSDSHSRKNARKPAKEALDTMVNLIADTVVSGVSVRAGLQCAFGCVYEGEIDQNAVLDAAVKFAEAGASEINLADTTGMAHPEKVTSLVGVIQREIPEIPLSLHVHDTRGLGLVNMYAGYLAGVRTFDVCVGGLGGCPFVKGAAGNVPTEDAVNMFSALGIDTGIDIKSICSTVADVEKSLDKNLPGRMAVVLKSGK